MINSIGKSLHITWDELACKDKIHTPYPIEFIKDGRVIELVVMFERIRALYNKPLVIHSAYRTLAHNTSIGGSLNSPHIQGKALDIEPPIGIDVDTFHSDVKLRYKDFGIRGLGKYNSFIHCDIRDSDTLVEWVG